VQKRKRTAKRTDPTSKDKVSSTPKTTQNDYKTIENIDWNSDLLSHYRPKAQANAALRPKSKIAMYRRFERSYFFSKKLSDMKATPFLIMFAPYAQASSFVMKSIPSFCFLFALLLAHVAAGQKTQTLPTTQAPSAFSNPNYTRMASVARNNNCVDIFCIKPNGSVVGAYWYSGIDNFLPSSFAPIGSASTEGGITATSRYEGTIEV